MVTEGSSSQVYGIHYPKTIIAQKIAFQVLRRILKCGPVYRVFHDGWYYLAAVFEFDPGPFGVMMALNVSDTFEPWSELGVHLVESKPPVGYWPNRVWHKGLLILFGLPIFMFVDRRGSMAPVEMFRFLARKGSFFRTFI